MGVVMSAQDGVSEFRDDDDGYLEWLAGHAGGFVVNILRSHNATGARVHRAVCGAIGSRPARGGTLTEGAYSKVCSDDLGALADWAQGTVGKSIKECGTCKPANATVPAGRRLQARKAVGTAMANGRFEVQRLTGNSAGVLAFADDYVRFENLPHWQQQVRAVIRSYCGQLRPSPEQVLHAEFFGAKHPNADVENLVLYYIDSFKAAGRNGIRFEHGEVTPQAPGGGDAAYRYCYSYSLSARDGAFKHWGRGDTLASFDWTSLGAFSGDKKLAQVWLALSRGGIKVSKHAAPETPFGVRVEVRPPTGRMPVWGGLVKGIFDGVICALQTHTEPSIPPEVPARLAKHLAAQAGEGDLAEEIEMFLRDPGRAVLGGVPRLVSPYRAGVKWDPSDHFCVAGELLAAQPEEGARHWSIRGEVFELFRPSGDSAHSAQPAPPAPAPRSVLVQV